MGEGWLPPQQQQLPSPPPTPPKSVKNALQTPYLLPQSPLISPASGAPQSAPFALLGSQPTEPVPVPTKPLSSSPCSQIMSSISRLADCDMGETEEGLEWYAWLRKMGLNSFQIRIIWKYRRGVEWKQIAFEEGAITGRRTHNALMMDLSRWRVKYPALNEQLPLRRPSRKSTRKSGKKPSGQTTARR
ncbi:PCI/PINT associated module [Metarhizium robertsii ARSEF 23]|uniref:PCI/PINT associated module n=1 Tax=Metarhizium robertsii (strain ARSEF 23 / ATCC MYA-3075) TaxID=655844 RepID=A0A0B2XDL5_METRA|nr:PCI/PINT associated module [Metarhizium robertsii ARSEF 23]KHO10845.1 PCI/PINT associated module [Metarhizium robertsii ARSEF 23]